MPIVIDKGRERIKMGSRGSFSRFIVESGFWKVCDVFGDATNQANHWRRQQNFICLARSPL